MFDGYSEEPMMHHEAAANSLTPLTQQSGPCPVDLPSMDSSLPSISTPSRIVDSTAPIASVDKDAWSLAALGDPSGRRLPTIWFMGNPKATNLKEPFPDDYRVAAKRYIWLLINVPTPDVLLNATNSKISEWYPASTIQAKFVNIRKLFVWLSNQNVASLSWCTPELLDAYSQHIYSTHKPRTASLVLQEVWMLSQWAPLLPPDDRLCVPNWVGRGRSNGISPFQPGSVTPPIHPETIDPLLNWSLAMINDIQRDVFAALEEVQGGGHQTFGATNPHEWLANYLESTQGRVPTILRRTPPKTAISYLSYLSGFSRSRISDALRRTNVKWTHDPLLPTSINAPVTAHVAGQPWTDYLDYYELVSNGLRFPPLVRNLQSAAMLIICYLTACRAEEVYTLKVGCIEEMPPTSDGMTGYFVNGTLWKRKGTGVAAKWPAVAPVADAVRLLERINGQRSEWLLSTMNGDRPRPDTVVRNLREFSDFCQHRTRALSYPAGFESAEDPEGDLTFKRLRRTVAFAYARQPDGDFITGVQFKHTQAILGSQGYASYASLPEGATLRAEERQVRIELLNEVAATLTGGTHVSGPAAGRLVEAATRVKATIASERASKRFLADPELQVFANPSQMSLCVYKASTALCADTGTEPDRGTCESVCPNHARTDVEIEQMRADTEQLLREAASPLTPEPMADRLSRRAARFQNLIQQHTDTATVIKLGNNS